MSRISVLAEATRQRAVRPLTEASPKAPLMSPKDELQLLEKKSQEKGMSYDEMNKIRQIGVCDSQIQTQIARHHEWLAAHQ